MPFNSETTPNNDFNKNFALFNFRRLGKNTKFEDKFFRGFAKKREICEN